MNDVIFSTRGTKTAKIIFMIVCSVFIGLFCIFISNIFPHVNTMYYDLSDSYKTSVWVISLSVALLLSAAIFIILCAFKYGLTYVDVYRDRFVGKGLPKQSMYANSELFNIKNEQIINVTMIRNWFLCIHTVSGKYYIMTNQKTGAEIMNYYAELKG